MILTYGSFVLWDFVLVYEGAHVGAGDGVGRVLFTCVPIKEWAELFTHGQFPLAACGGLSEFLVFRMSAGVGIDCCGAFAWVESCALSPAIRRHP